MGFLRSFLSNNSSHFLIIIQVFIYNFIFYVNFSFADFNQNVKNVRQIEVGISHMCVVTSDNELYCWGNNVNGAVGVGKDVHYQSEPVKVLNNVKEFALTSSNTCAINKIGDLYCWGGNYYGQIGNGTTLAQSSPVKVLSNIVQFGLSDCGYVCAVNTASELYCWGNELFSQGENKSGKHQLIPTKVLTQVSKVKFGLAHLLRVNSKFQWKGHLCALKKNGDLYCWGMNDKYQVGVDTDETFLMKPTKVLSSVKDFVLARSHTCAISNDNDMYCWGSYKSNTKDRNSIDLKVPTKLAGDIYKVNVADGFTCAISNDKDLFCWGSIGFAYQTDIRLGEKGRYKKELPISLLHQIKDVAISKDHICALNIKGELYCWGDNSCKKVGSKEEVLVAKTSNLVANNVLKVIVDNDNTCVIDSDNVLKCRGCDKNNIISKIDKL